MDIDFLVWTLNKHVANHCIKRCKYDVSVGRYFTNEEIDFCPSLSVLIPGCYVCKSVHKIYNWCGVSVSAIRKDYIWNSNLVFITQFVCCCKKLMISLDKCTMRINQSQVGSEQQRQIKSCFLIVYEPSYLLDQNVNVTLPSFENTGSQTCEWKVDDSPDNMMSRHEKWTNSSDVFHWINNWIFFEMTQWRKDAYIQHVCKYSRIGCAFGLLWSGKEWSIFILTFLLSDYLWFQSDRSGNNGLQSNHGLSDTVSFYNVEIFISFEWRANAQNLN